MERTFVWMGRCRPLSRDYQRTLASAQVGGGRWQLAGS
ncbi:MAG: hypothetical protein OXC57_00705 [Rhodobacteraceae bacterium]|nr:hypothetical protein [Paracoccaceae bacterium]